MKTFQCLVMAVAAGVILNGGLAARGAISFTDNGGGNYTASDSGLGQVIPDNTPAGVAYSLNFGATGLNISDVSVTLNLSGGYNGDLYAYLANGSQLVTLLNPSATLSGAGFNVTFVEGAGNPIPTSGGGGITGSGYTAYTDLAVLNWADPNGSWTLFFADTSPGDTATLNSFSVNFATSAVPEPVNTALAIMSGIFVLAGASRWRRQHWPRGLKNQSGM